MRGEVQFPGGLSSLRAEIEFILSYAQMVEKEN